MQRLTNLRNALAQDQSPPPAALHGAGFVPQVDRAQLAATPTSKKCRGRPVGFVPQVDRAQLAATPTSNKCRGRPVGDLDTSLVAVNGAAAESTVPAGKDAATRGALAAAACSRAANVDPALEAGHDPPPSSSLAPQANSGSSLSVGGGSEGGEAGGNIKFMCDSMLGKAVKWLRCLGVDTVLWEGSRSPLVPALTPLLPVLLPPSSPSPFLLHHNHHLILQYKLEPLTRMA